MDFNLFGALLIILVILESSIDFIYILEKLTFFPFCTSLKLIDTLAVRTIQMKERKRFIALLQKVLSDVDYCLHK